MSWSGKINPMSKKVGFFGGTFDPPHLGHLSLARHATEKMELDHLLWVLTPMSPFKKQTHASLDQRIHMVKLTAEELPGSEYCSIDVDREPPYYTCDTARLIKQTLAPDDKLYFLLGADSLTGLPKWYHAAELVNDYLDGLIVARRPGTALDLTLLNEQMPGIDQKISFVDMPCIDISSREIRKKIKGGKTGKKYMPPPVYQFIEESSLYTS
jgi:nicotinate-nucleotide adenylyltransferase